jgi:hypothetical protein
MTGNRAGSTWAKARSGVDYSLNVTAGADPSQTARV